MTPFSMGWPWEMHDSNAKIESFKSWGSPARLQLKSCEELTHYVHVLFSASCEALSTAVHRLLDELSPHKL